jgi:hypothetical protein
MARISKAGKVKPQKKAMPVPAKGKNLRGLGKPVQQTKKVSRTPAAAVSQKARNEKIVAAYKKGTSGIVIAKQVGLSAVQVYKIINQAGAGKNTGAKKLPAKKTVTKKAPAKPAISKKLPPKAAPVKKTPGRKKGK